MAKYWAERQEGEDAWTKGVEFHNCPYGVPTIITRKAGKLKFTVMGTKPKPRMKGRFNAWCRGFEDMQEAYHNDWLQSASAEA